MINEFVEPGHFYSVIPHVTKEFNESNAIKYDLLDFNDDSHIQILNELPQYLTNFDKNFGISNITKK